MQKPESRLDFNISHLSEIFPLFALRFSERTDFETEQRKEWNVVILRVIHNLKKISGKTADKCNWFWTKILLYASFSLFLGEYHSWEKNTINLIHYIN